MNYSRWFVNRVFRLEAKFHTRGYPSSFQFDDNNHLYPAGCGSGAFCYDAAGNLTSDGVHAYTYDAEGADGPGF